ncbi:MAG: hypothetical protein FWD15_05160 [Alphaproteobacteria bacterium]|nr:hypothetical protein [Alphaproteobacteria bacterium]
MSTNSIFALYAIHEQKGYPVDYEAREPYVPNPRDRGPIIPKTDYSKKDYSWLVREKQNQKN